MGMLSKEGHLVVFCRKFDIAYVEVVGGSCPVNRASSDVVGTTVVPNMGVTIRST